MKKLIILLASLCLVACSNDRAKWQHVHYVLGYPEDSIMVDYMASHISEKEIRKGDSLLLKYDLKYIGYNGFLDTTQIRNNQLESCDLSYLSQKTGQRVYMYCRYDRPILASDVKIWGHPFYEALYEKTNVRFYVCIGSARITDPVIYCIPYDSIKGTHIQKSKIKKYKLKMENGKYINLP